VSAYFTLPPDMAIFLRQMKLLGVSLPLMGSATITSTNVVRLLGKTLNGDYATTDFVANSNPVAEAFAQAFEARYHKRADIDSSSSWDAVRILATAMRHYGTSHPAIRKGILSLRNFPGAESPGHYNFILCDALRSMQSLARLPPPRSHVGLLVLLLDIER